MTSSAARQPASLSHRSPSSSAGGDPPRGTSAQASLVTRFATRFALPKSLAARIAGLRWVALAVILAAALHVAEDVAFRRTNSRFYARVDDVSNAAVVLRSSDVAGADSTSCPDSTGGSGMSDAGDWGDGRRGTGRAAVQVFVYEMPRRFNYDLVTRYWEEKRRGKEKRQQERRKGGKGGGDKRIDGGRGEGKGGGEAGREIKRYGSLLLENGSKNQKERGSGWWEYPDHQHAAEWFLYKHLVNGTHAGDTSINNATSSRSSRSVTNAAAVRVWNSSLADVVFVPFFSSLLLKVAQATADRAAAERATTDRATSDRAVANTTAGGRTAAVDKAPAVTAASGSSADGASAAEAGTGTAAAAVSDVSNSSKVIKAFRQLRQVVPATEPTTESDPALDASSDPSVDPSIHPSTPRSLVLTADSISIETEEAAALAWVQAQPEWQRCRGCDHVWPAQHPNALSSIRSALLSDGLGFAPLLLLSDFGRYEGRQAGLDKDVIIPYVHRVKAVRGGGRRGRRNRRGLVLERTRCCSSEGAFIEKTYADGVVRDQLFSLLANQTGVVMAQGRQTRADIAAAQAGMRAARFCLHPVGDTPSGGRLFDAAVSRCVPVVVSDYIELPFEDQLAYHTFCVFVGQEEAVRPGYLLYLLRAELANGGWLQRYREVGRVMGAFQYEEREGGRAVEMIWRKIGTKVSRVAEQRNRYLRSVRSS
ncbi:hypothetical protein CLOM_g5342 [Closterium sp. NIES-68]|nr:hypothetical protein CLOM_g5342 [Closterium sp. NIES-68]